MGKDVPIAPARVDCDEPREQLAVSYFSSGAVLSRAGVANLVEAVDSVQKIVVARDDTKLITMNVRVFRDEGVSGTKELENWPAFVEMLTALHSNGTKLMLVEKLDRLARDLMIQETIIGDLRKNSFELISVMEPDLLQDDPSRKLMRQIFGAIAEYEKTMIVLKLRAAKSAEVRISRRSRESKK